MRCLGDAEGEKEEESLGIWAQEHLLLPWGAASDNRRCRILSHTSILPPGPSTLSSPASFSLNSKKEIERPLFNTVSQKLICWVLTKDWILLPDNSVSHIRLFLRKYKRKIVFFFLNFKSNLILILVLLNWWI